MTSQELTLLGERITRQGGWRYEGRGCPGCRKLCSQKLRSGKLCSGNFHLRRGEDVARDQWPPDVIRHLQAIRRCRSSPLSGDPRYTRLLCILSINTYHISSNVSSSSSRTRNILFIYYVILYILFYFIFYNYSHCAMI